jgi:predicted TIM-barrel fold metal-dependent hydrolase
MINGKFVIDAVVHAFNLHPDNYAVPEHARDIAAQVLGAMSATPPDLLLSPESIMRDWPIEDTTSMLFHESVTDVAIYHPTPIYAFKDGFSSIDKGVEAITKWPNRYVGAYAAVDPLGGKDAVAFLREQVDVLNPIGLKLYPASWGTGGAQGWRMDDPKVAFPLYEAALELGITTVAIHKASPLGGVPELGAFEPMDVDGAAAAFPNINFEIVHGGMAFTEETAWILARHPNVYVNLETLNIILVQRPRVFARLLLELLHIGGDGIYNRLLWSSGAMQYHPQPCLEALEAFTFPEDLLETYGLIAPIAQIGDREKALMLGENYAALHGLDIDSLKEGVAGDEFDARDGLAAPYSTTSIAADGLVNARSTS